MSQTRRHTKFAPTERSTRPRAKARGRAYRLYQFLFFGHVVVVDGGIQQVGIRIAFIINLNRLPLRFTSLVINVGYSIPLSNIP